MNSRLVLACVLAAAMPAWATPINYSESWEYGTGTSDPVYAAQWAANPGRMSVQPTYDRTGDKSLLIDNGSSYGNLGMTHVLPQAVRGTDADPLVLSTYMAVTAGTYRQYLDFTLELASGNVVAPASGPENVVAIGRSITLNGQNARFYVYDGNAWNDTGDALGTYTPAPKWWLVEVTIKSTELVWRLVNDTGLSTYTDTFSLAGHLQGMYFDRINIRHPGAANSATHVGYIDDLSLLGGEVIPEPATVAGLVLLLPLLGRRRG